MFRKLTTRIVRQFQPHLKRDLYHAETTILHVDRQRATGELHRFELSWEASRGARFFLEWTAGGPLRAGEVDDGEGFSAGGHKRSPVEKSSVHTQGHIVELGRRLFEAEGESLPQWLQRAMWAVLGATGPGATQRRVRG